LLIKLLLAKYGRFTFIVPAGMTWIYWGILARPDHKTNPPPQKQVSKGLALWPDRSIPKEGGQSPSFLLVSDQELFVDYTQTTGKPEIIAALFPPDCVPSCL